MKHLRLFCVVAPCSYFMEVRPTCSATELCPLSIPAGRLPRRGSEFERDRRQTSGSEP
jgi:hypothetical protein